MSIERISLPHLPQYVLHVGVFSDISNAAFLRQQLLAGNSDFEYAFLDAATILSRNHLLAACFRAINDLLHDRLKSRNVHSEIVFSLSPNNNIAESFRRFGVTDDSKNIIAVKVSGTENDSGESIAQHLKEHVQGTLQPFTDETISGMHDSQRLRKIYKLEAPKKGEPAHILGSQAESFVLASIALKGS